MGVMDKFLNVMKLSDTDDYDMDDYYEDEEPVEKVKKASYKVEEDDFDDYEEPKVRKASTQKVTPIRQTKRTNGNGMQVCVIKPTSVEDAREITETLLSNRTVVLNMEGLDIDVAQRIIDFASGATYAMRGNLQTISNYICILTPARVDISGDFQEIFSGTFSVPPMSHDAI